MRGVSVTSLVLSTACALVAIPTQSADLSWSGLYRVEGVKLENAELDSVRRDKAYILHHFILSPKVVAADGVTVFGRFDIMNNNGFGQNNQAGETLGSGPRGDNPRVNPNGPTNANNSNVFSDQQQSSEIAVTQLYASWVHEFGQFVVGRVPRQFGLGVSHNAGNGMFDHYFDTADIVGYKFVLGNLFLMPIMGKVNEGALNEEDDVNDYILHLQYDNPETDLGFGIYWQRRIATRNGNDAPAGGAVGGATSSTQQAFSQQLVSFYTAQRFGGFRVGVEAGIQDGATGVRTADDSPVKMNGYGVASEFSYRGESSKTEWTLKAGIASGDDPGTDDAYEGFVFDRNYDVAFLLFNHPLGQGDFFRTNMARNTATQTSDNIDNEAISNVIYIAPSFQNYWKDNLSWGMTLATGFLGRDPYRDGDTAKELGYELDVNLTYKPYERFTWVTGIGALFPGDAWKGGTTNGFQNKFAYGVTTKAAISF